MRRGGVAGVLVGAVLIAGCSDDVGRPAPAASRSFGPGAAGVGDPYYPTAGNGGYDVGGYDLKLRFDPSSGELSGTATITATATQDLSRFNFDLVGMTVTSVKINGTDAQSARDGGELVVTPAAGIARGSAFTTVVDYGGKPSRVGDKALGAGGWLKTDDGAIALGQPESASSWYPVNDHPSDKATFALAMTVPDGLEVLSNGVPGKSDKSSGWTTWRWAEASPMASYLSMVVIGQYQVTTTEHGGKPMVTAIPASAAADGAEAQSMALTGRITDFLATKFGPYPFDANGGVVVDEPSIGYALETQSRPVYGGSFFSGGANARVVAHELAHQWFGDSVALERWKDIWLNEGFATYAEWLWAEHEGQRTVQQSFDAAYSTYPWDVVDHTGDPGAKRLFGDAVYQRGGMTVYALRRTIGDEAFDRLLRQWTSEHRDGNADTEDLKAMAEKLSGKDLDAFFQAWLLGDAKPAKP